MAEAAVITDLAAIIGILEKPVVAKFELDGQKCSLEVRRALPAVVERRREILRAVQPPFVKERDNYDTLNPQYLARRDQSILLSRALTIYLCCPQVAAMKPNLTLAEDIGRFIGSILPETIAELIELTALAGGMDVEVTKRANFT